MVMVLQLSVIFFLFCGIPSNINAFILPKETSIGKISSCSESMVSPSLNAVGVKTSSEFSIQSYEYNGWNLRYRFKPPSPGYEKSPPLLLVHPVGIGLSSWFWERFLQVWVGSAVYAPNLIGCGVSEGGDPWEPDKRGLFIPLGWVEGCEALMNKASEQSNKSLSWIVFTSGGLAPVGTMLAARNPDLVCKLVMASPPPWKDMTTPVPESELARSFNYLKSPFGNLFFNLLESRSIIQFFSNQFLFSKPCDSKWLDNTEKELGPKSRPPVMAFNSGFCLHRSFEEELCTLSQSTLILSGQDDKRQREEYVKYMKNCLLESLPGQNVLPWESPNEVAEALMS